MNFADVTPNLIVNDIDRSAAFYRDVLGFATVTTVPENPPFVFVWVQRGSVNVFLNARQGLGEDLPTLAERTIGGTNTLFVAIEADTPAAGVDALFEATRDRAPVLMPLKNQFYGMREFAIEDPDGYVLIFAQRIA
jgi:catechol 2,3-dioxygenase-like lactoylglutathione lyase family enzyme